MNIAMFLQMAAETCGDRTALTSGDQHYTYGELFAAAQVAADVFRNHDVAYVSVLDISSPAVPIALMGAAIAGIPYVPLNYRLTPVELGELIERITPAYLVVGEGAASDPAGATVVGRNEFLRTTLQGTSTDVVWADDPQAVAVQLFTSGTTGTPKAAILRNEHLVSYILGTVEFMGADEQEATLVSVPPYHIAGIAAVMSSLYACRRIVQLPDFSPATWLELVERERVTNAFVVPTMLSRVIDHLDNAGLAPEMPTLQALAYGGGRMPVKVIERALDIFPAVNFTNAYGLTETSSTVSLLGPDDHRQAIASPDPGTRGRLASVGKALPSVEIEIRNDAGEVLGPNEHGEIYVRGPQVSGEYAERNALGDDGWFPTRDAGLVDDHGYLYLSGRADDVIVRGGENISPAEVENVLLSHDDVVDAAVVGIASEEWGESVAAAIVLKPGANTSAADLQQLVKTSLRSSRVPEVIQFLTELPYNETGKLLRRVVKQLFA
jgi:long-chain acyl-CoA synthetase